MTNILWMFGVFQVFDKYVKERAEEERKERKQRAKEAKDNFQKLLEEAELTGRSDYHNNNYYFYSFRFHAR